jgi:hypothetical protein
MPHELDAVVERVEVREGLRSPRQCADREERACREEERRVHGADDVIGVLEGLEKPATEIPKHAEPTPATSGTSRTGRGRRWRRPPRSRPCGPDVLDVFVAADAAYERTDAEAERERVDRRLDGRRER